MVSHLDEVVYLDSETALGDISTDGGSPLQSNGRLLDVDVFVDEASRRKVESKNPEFRIVVVRSRNQISRETGDGVGGHPSG